MGEAVSQRQDPDEIAEASISRTVVQMKDGRAGILNVLAAAGLAKSKSEARQKVLEGAVNIGSERTKITDPKAEIEIADGLIIRLGATCDASNSTTDRGLCLCGDRPPGLSVLPGQEARRH